MIASTLNLNELINALHLEYGERQIELFHVNDITLLIAIVLSANVTDHSVNKVVTSLFQKVFLPEHFIELGFDGLCHSIKNIGLYKQKARSILEIARVVKENGKVPDCFDDLIKLRGVGRKTANVYLNVRYGMPKIGIDTHVIKVMKRVGVQFASILQLEKILASEISQSILPKAQLLIVHHGRYTCKARNPSCKQCCISQMCQYNQKTLSKD